jgi:integrase
MASNLLGGLPPLGLFLLGKFKTSQRLPVRWRRGRFQVSVTRSLWVFFFEARRLLIKGARHLSKQKIQSLAQSFCGEYETRNRTPFLLGLNIGNKISELSALNVGDVWQYGKPFEILDLRKAINKGKKTRQIPLNEQTKEVINELIRWKDVLIRKPKEKKPKFVPFSDENLATIRSFPRSLPHLYFFRHEKGWSGVKPGSRMGRDCLWKAWHKACLNLGIKGVDLYGGTKHSSATNLRKYFPWSRSYRQLCTQPIRYLRDIYRSRLRTL